MIHGIYLATHGANAQTLKQDVIANNLANASTTAFKRDVATFKALSPRDSNSNFPDRLRHELQRESGAIEVDKITTDHSTSAFEKTDSQWHIAISGKGFLRVSDGTDEYLTRNGQLRKSIDNELVMADTGMKILDDTGSEFQIPDDSVGIEIGANGQVNSIDPQGRFVDLGKLDLVTAPPDQLRKLGNSLYQTEATLNAAEGAQVSQGFLESSGVNPVLEMAAMIETSRAFESNVNLIRMQDDSLGRLLQSVSG